MGWKRPHSIAAWPRFLAWQVSQLKFHPMLPGLCFVPWDPKGGIAACYLAAGKKGGGKEKKMKGKRQKAAIFGVFTIKAISLTTTLGSTTIALNHACRVTKSPSVSLLICWETKAIRLAVALQRDHNHQSADTTYKPLPLTYSNARKATRYANIILPQYINRRAD